MVLSYETLFPKNYKSQHSRRLPDSCPWDLQINLGHYIYGFLIPHLMFCSKQNLPFWLAGEPTPET